MAIADITKPMALDETLQDTNTALGLLAKDTTVASIATALALLGKDSSLQSIVTALGLLNKDATMVTQNSKLDTIIAKLQGIIEALGVDTSIYKAAGNKACAELTSSLLVAGNLGNVYNITDNGTTTADFVEGAGKPIHLGDNVAVVDIGEGGSHVYKFDLLSGLVDLSNYIQKSETAGLIKNDGTIDETPYTVVEESDVNGNIIIDDVETPVYRNYGNNTVLSTDKTPFLTRQTLNPTGFSGYVREKLIGASYAWNQLVQNGNFADTSGWTATNTTFTVSGNVATMARVSTSGGSYIRRTVSKIAGHKYFFSITAKHNSSNVHNILVRWYKSGSSGNQIDLVPPTPISSSYQTFKGIITTDSADADGDVIIYNVSNDTDSNNIKDFYIIDLTLAFGSTIADYLYGLSNNGGITKLRDMGCPIDTYTPYGYNLVSSKTSGKKIVGKNLFNGTPSVINKFLGNNGEEISASGWRISQYMLIKASTTYTVIYNGNLSGAYICWYDGAKTFIGSALYGSGSSLSCTVSANAKYLRISYYVTTTNIQVAEGTSTTYEPYSEITYSLGNDELRGKFDLVNGEIVASGDVKESNGTKHVNYKEIDLGTLTYSYYSSGSTPFFYTVISDAAGNVSASNSLCSKYLVSQDATDKTIFWNGTQIRIIDSAYTDPAVFKTAMDGVKLLYPLATPTTEQSTPFADPMSMVGATTEEYIDEREIPCPVGAERQYMGQSEDVIPIPSMPQSDGVWVQKCYVSGGKAQYVWELEE